MLRNIEETEIDLPQIGPLPVRLRPSARATRLKLRIDPAFDGVEIVVPNGISRKTAISMLYQHGDWVTAHMSRLPERVQFVPGAWVPFMGNEHAIRTIPDAKRGVWAEAGVIWVSGLPEHTNRRVSDWLKKQAKLEISPRAHAYAERIGKKVNRISLKDTRTRWGSCSSNGNLSFSWRLVLAPEDVLDYVVAHEVAHLQELNHSARFWAVVENLYGPSKKQQHWLKKNGSALHRYGAGT
ncbi:M48 family metallopeptidase [Thalassospira xiamenensis]|uniref:M48 family metallopeptidase n=1 Tax=Thalassospira xiamenensis TaxID=220697 RepID=UPI001FFEFA14|nr:SprT family zinc-dependent metalloprotease [Thalassospira xiamenensis]MCK2168633.1 M48 family metallopeptidase [Thalassospira xiamenensis]